MLDWRIASRQGMVWPMSDLKLYAVHSGDLTELEVPGQIGDLHDAFDAAGNVAGIYSALRSYHGNRFLRMDAHMDRCRRCVESAGWTTTFALDSLARAIGQAVDAWADGDVRVRFDLLERPVKIGVTTTQVMLGLSAHRPVPDAVMQQGARLALAPSELGRPRPTIKFTDWVRERRACQEHDPDAFEHLLVDTEGRILEGSSSNFHAILDGELVTAADGVLQGITRLVVLELAQRRGLSIERRRLSPAELAVCEEAFITSSTREIVPVTRVAQQSIGDGKPGPTTRLLLADYRAYAEQNAITIADYLRE
jgi:branched-chain amino acid aminotransferase